MMQKKMLIISRKALIKVLLIVTVLRSIYACNSPKEVNLISNGENTVLPIAELNSYSFKDYQIYKIGVNRTLPGFHGIIQGGILAIKANTVYTIYINNNCIDRYQNGWYSIIDYGQKTPKDINLCDIKISRLFSTNYNIGDTISEIAQDYDWCILKNKFVDNTLKDTVFLYEYKTNQNDYTWFSFTYSQGFIGVSNLRKDITGKVVAIEKGYGKIYEEELNKFYPDATIEKEKDFKTEFRDIDISLIKEFKIRN